MKSKKVFLGALLFFLSIVFFLSSLLPDFQPKAIQGKKEQSLVRKDLLLRKERKLETPKRNIFSPKSSLRGEFISESQEVGANPLGMEASSKEDEGQTAITIRYIGYIDSPQKIIGLIIFENEALAVEEGELLRMGIKVGKITPGEIEIIGPDSARRKFSLEGERE